MTRSKLIGSIAAAIMLIAGGIYLKLGESSLVYVLCVFIVCVCVMGGVKAAEAKSAGARGVIPYIPAICYGVLGAFIAAALVFKLIS